MLRAISWLLYPWGDQLQQFPLSRGQVVSALTAAFEILVQLVEVGAQHRKKCAVSRLKSPPSWRASRMRLDRPGGADSTGSLRARLRIVA